MTWSEFKADVKTLLTVDANRLGTTSFTDRYIIGGTEAVLSHVPFYRSTNSTRYNKSVIFVTINIFKLFKSNLAFFI